MIQRTITPGPWEVSEVDESTEEYEVVAPNSGWDTICEGISLTEPNARLISAAPDLLAALEEVEYGQLVLNRDGPLNECPKCQVTEGNGHDDDCLVGNALAKAKGEHS